MKLDAPQDWLAQSPHRRWNPLQRTWVLVSPHRNRRPWQGEVASTSETAKLRYDPKCYLCPGNARANGECNPHYEDVFVFTNDYAALLPDTPIAATRDGLLRAETVRGLCRVVCFDPDHSLTLADMPGPSIERVVAAWQREFRELSALDWVRYVQIFENRGAMMGASNPHPHGQIWATGWLPDEPAREADAMKAHAVEYGECLLCTYVQVEKQKQERVVYENGEFLAVVPWWAVWPFEILVLPLKHVASMNSFSSAHGAGLADVLSQVTKRYNALFAASFPYTMGFHQSAADDAAHFHAHFYPPLLRSASVRKFMVGFEMLGMPQRDMTPEQAAERLRSAVPT